MRPRRRQLDSDLPPAVVLGGTTTGLSLARSLTDAGVEVVVLDKRESPSRTSRLRREFVALDPVDMQGQMLDWLRVGPPGAVLLTGGDEGLELIARNRTELEALGYLPMEADDSVLVDMLDKDATHALARQHDIPVAGTWPLRDQRDVDAAVARASFPCVLKPVHSHVFARQVKTGAKVLTVASAAELRQTFEAMSGLGVELSMIEVITGPDDEYVSYYAYLDETGHPLLQLTKRKLRQNPPRFGIGTYHAMSHDAELAELGLRFFEAVGLRGLGNVEFKRDGRDGKLKLIECNARFTMSNELIRRAGVDLALFAYNRLTGRPLPSVDSYRDDLRLWDPVNDTRAFFAYQRAGDLSFADWGASLLHRQCFPVARLDDPVPCLVRQGQGVGRRLGSRVGVRSAPAASAMSRIAGSAGRVRALAARLDLGQAVGPRYVLRRARAERDLGGWAERVRNETYERIWHDAAEASGARSQPLTTGMFELTRDGARTRVFQQVVDLDDPVTLRVALDKVLVHDLLRERGVPTAEHLAFDVRQPGPAADFLDRAPGPCVIKPAAGTAGGHGTTAGVRRRDQLHRACLHAPRETDRLLIEHQAPGEVHRLLFLDGELLDTVSSRPPRVTGDGHSTIAELIEAENQRRIRAEGAAGLAKLGVNLDMVLTLERLGLDFATVLPAGRTCPVRTITNSNGADDNATYRGPIAAEVIASARTAIDVVGLRLAGVDVITTDLSRPLLETGGIIAEVNGNPGLHHHYLVAEPERATRVALPVVESLLEEAAAGSRNSGVTAAERV